MAYTDLAPTIVRQRLVVEGIPTWRIAPAHIAAYLSSLSSVAEMHKLMEPVVHKSPLYGWAGWVHWETSGAHFYAWDDPLLFFSVDIYTCKAFDVAKVVDYTRQALNAKEITFKSF